jgi:hypothetical protein
MSQKSIFYYVLLDFKSIINLSAVTEFVEFFLDVIVVFSVSFPETIFLVVRLNSLKVAGKIFLFWGVYLLILIANGISSCERCENIWPTLQVLPRRLFTFVL